MNRLRKMRNLLKYRNLIIFLLVCCFAVVGCGKNDPAPVTEAATAVPQSTPEPTPEPVIPVVVANQKAMDAGFFDLLPESAEIEKQIASVPVADNTAAAFIWVEDDTDAELVRNLLSEDIPVVAYNEIGAELPEETVEIRFSGLSATEEAAMETAIAYPPHDTPVRMIGLFSSEDSKARSVWNKAIDEGKVLSKGIYTGAVDSSLDGWIGEMLGRYFPGMLDCAYAETPEYAAAVAKRLADAGRTDFEVFTVGTDKDLAALSQNLPEVLPGVGVDTAQALKAGADAVEQLLSLQHPDDIVLGE